MAFPTLGLTSPHTKNKLVEEAQTLLKTNRFNTVFLADKVDGEYGPITAAAAHRAKYLLGYPSKKIDGRFGATIRSFLLPLDKGGKKLPLAYALRRKARIKWEKAHPKTRGEKIIEFAKTFLGYRETPVNHTMFGKWYGLDGSAWCGMFASYVLAHFGSKFRYAYVPFIVNDAYAHRNGLSVTTTPEQGDLVCFDWGGSNGFDHVGLFDAWTNKAAGKFKTVEGNTLPPGGVGNQSNGGGVYARDRGTKDGYKVVFVKVA